MNNFKQIELYLELSDDGEIIVCGGKNLPSGLLMFPGTRIAIQNMDMNEYIHTICPECGEKKENIQVECEFCQTHEYVAVCDLNINTKEE